MTSDIVFVWNQIVLGSEHISFTTTKIGSLLDVEDSKDPEGLRVFYYLVQVPVICALGSAFAFICVKIVISLMAWMCMIVSSLCLSQDLKCFVFAICQMHFKIKPIS
jgi:hypothetical protein